MNAQEAAARAQTQAVASAPAQERDPFAAYDLMSEETPVEGGHGTVAFATRKSTGVTCLVYVPRSRKRAQAIPVTGILTAGFTPASEDAGDDTPDPEPVEDIDATDGARKRADELGVDLSTVTGTGKDGRITADDVSAASE